MCNAMRMFWFISLNREGGLCAVLHYTKHSYWNISIILISFLALFHPHPPWEEHFVPLHPLLCYLVPWSCEIFITQGPSESTRSPYTRILWAKRGNCSSQPSPNETRPSEWEEKDSSALGERPYESNQFILEGCTYETVHIQKLDHGSIRSLCLQGRQHAGI